MAFLRHMLQSRLRMTALLKMFLQIVIQLQDMAIMMVILILMELSMSQRMNMMKSRMMTKITKMTRMMYSIQVEEAEPALLMTGIRRNMP